MKKVCMFAAVVLLLTGMQPCFADLGKELTVVFTGDTSGKLIACSCPNDPAGGLAERVTLINDMRSYMSPFLLVEPGRMISLFGEFEDKSGVTMELMNMMGYDAAGIDTWEVFHGLEGTGTMRETADFPLLSASVVDKKGTLAFDPFMIKNIGDVRVAVISLADSSGIYRIGAADVSDFSFLPPEQALSDVLKKLPENIDYIVVLSTMEKDTNETILQSFPVIDLIVETNGNYPNPSPTVADNGIIVNTGGRGQFVGAVTIRHSGNGQPEVVEYAVNPVLEIPADREAEELVVEYYDSIGQILVLE